MVEEVGTGFHHARHRIGPRHVRITIQVEVHRHRTERGSGGRNLAPGPARRIADALDPAHGAAVTGHEHVQITVEIQIHRRRRRRIHH